MAKGKKFEKGGESLNLRNALKISFLFFRPYANNFENFLSKVYNFILRICVCLCWHQSPKRGRLKGKWP
jgi:hypothetical protein